MTGNETGPITPRPITNKECAHGPTQANLAQADVRMRLRPGGGNPPEVPVHPARGLSPIEHRRQPHGRTGAGPSARALVPTAPTAGPAPADQAGIIHEQQPRSEQPNIQREASPMNLRTEPWAHQKEALDFIIPRPGAMLAMEMGSGKSLCAVALMAESGRQRTLVLCPLSVVDHVWPQQIAAHSAAELQVIPLGSDVAGVKAKLQKAERDLRRRPGLPAVVIVNYESAWREPLGTWLTSQRWDLMVIDECHPEGTMIDTPAGKTPIEELKAGDAVWGVDHLTGRVVQAKVQHTFTRSTGEDLIAIGETSMTPEHPVWTTRGYIPAKDVNPDDTVARIAQENQAEDPSSALQMVRQELYGRPSHSPILRPVLRFESKNELPGGEGTQPEHHGPAGEPAGNSRETSTSPAVRLQPAAASGEQSQIKSRPAADGIRTPQRGQWPRVDGPQRILSERLEWPTEFTVPVKPRRKNLPTHFKIDLAEPALKIATLVDGESHKTARVKAADAKKKAYLESCGWTVLHFWNKEVLQDPAGVVEQVRNAVRSSTSKQPPATTLPKDFWSTTPTGSRTREGRRPGGSPGWRTGRPGGWP